MAHTDVVVGVDGSRHSERALFWAADEAYRRDARLRIIGSYAWRWPLDPTGEPPGLERVLRERFDQLVTDAQTAVWERYPHLTVDAEAVPEPPATALLDTADTAGLIVVGNRGHGGFERLLLGSVSRQVATHARIPVVVVRGRRGGSVGPIVVGVDGSATGEHALAAAFEEAVRRGDGLIAVRAYTEPVPIGGPGLPPLLYDPRALAVAERDSLDAAVAPWREKYPAVDIQVVVTAGSAARVLADLSAGAALVVVGSRGHGTLTGTLLGSVGLQLLHHAECPVLIARPVA